MRKQTMVGVLSLLGGLSAISTTSSAAVIVFEDIVPTSATEPCFSSVASVGCDLFFLDSGDFRFTSPDNGFSNHAHLVSSPFATGNQSYATNGTQYIGLDPSIIVMTSINGGAFSLMSFDAAEGFVISGSLHPNTASKLEIEGSLVGGGTVTDVVDFDGSNDGTGIGVDFESFALPGTFVNLTSVTFRGLNTSGDPAIFSLDNIEVSAVPLPPAAWLLGSSLLGLARFKRHRSKLSRGSQ